MYHAPLLSTSVLLESLSWISHIFTQIAIYITSPFFGLPRYSLRYEIRRTGGNDEVSNLLILLIGGKLVNLRYI